MFVSFVYITAKLQYIIWIEEYNSMPSKYPLMELASVGSYLTAYTSPFAVFVLCSSHIKKEELIDISGK